MTQEIPLRLHGIWPSQNEELMIRAAMADPSDAPELWDEWLTHNDLDRLSFGSFRLLPLLYTRLAAAKYDGPEMAKLRGAYRQSWYRNQLLMHAVEEMLGRLHQKGIPTLLMKGIPLALRTYGDRGARSMGDGDVLVPSHLSNEAIATLEAAGWARTNEFFPGHALGYRSSDGLEIDLHWYLTKYHKVDSASDPFWRGSVPFTLGSATTRAMNHTDELVHCLIHGVHWEQELPIRWVPDALTILDAHPGEIDWDRLVATSTDLQSGATVAAALEYLIVRFDADIPPHVMDALDQRTTRGQRVEHWFRLHATAKHPWGMIPLRWVAYWRSQREQGAVPTPMGFLAELKTTWGVSSWTGMLVEALRRLRRRFNWYVRSRRAHVALEEDPSG